LDLPDPYVGEEDAAEVVMEDIIVDWLIIDEWPIIESEPIFFESEPIFIESEPIFESEPIIDEPLEAAEAVCAASAAVSDMMTPFGAETATSSPTALSAGLGRAETRPERRAVAPIKGMV
jgi:hypothetical protein